MDLALQMCLTRAEREGVPPLLFFLIKLMVLLAFLPQGHIVGSGSTLCPPGALGPSGQNCFPAS